MRLVSVVVLQHSPVLLPLLQALAIPVCQVLNISIHSLAGQGAGGVSRAGPTVKTSRAAGTLEENFEKKNSRSFYYFIRFFAIYLFPLW